MSKTTFLFIVLVSLLVTPLALTRSQESKHSPDVRASVEYATVRFMEERTSIVWPDGTVQNVMELAGKRRFDGGDKYPKGSDYRMFWLTMAMNQMAQRGFEFAHMHDNDVVMKRLSH